MTKHTTKTQNCLDQLYTRLNKMCYEGMHTSRASYVTLKL